MDGFVHEGVGQEDILKVPRQDPSPFGDGLCSNRDYRRKGGNYDWC
jgi:hypothetical protein